MAQLARASGLGPEGCEFKSHYPDISLQLTSATDAIVSAGENEGEFLAKVSRIIKPPVHNHEMVLLPRRGFVPCFATNDFISCKSFDTANFLAW